MAQGDEHPVYVQGLGWLTYQQAMELVRTSGGHIRLEVIQYLESEFEQIWRRIEANPNTYIMYDEEFAVFNYFARRVTGHRSAIVRAIAEAAIRRYWESRRGRGHR